MGTYTALILFIAYMISVCLYAELQKECDYWEHEAKKWCGKLGEDKIERGLWKCEDCPDEDTDKCDACQTMIRR